MASAMYLESFLESIDNLPQELRRNFAVMRDLDQRTEDIKGDIEQTTKGYRSNVSRISKDDKMVQLSKLHDMFKKALEHSDNKVQIAMQMYEMVDKYIRKLDAELSRFEQELQLKDSMARRTSMSSISDMQSAVKPRGRKRSNGPGVEDSRGVSGSMGGPPGAGASKKRKTSSVAEDGRHASLTSPPPVTMAAGPSSDVLDMPVDPNEPTYCFCHQVSFGEMIGCDNADCPIEWFHFQCVNLTAKPKGKWYCPKCCQDRDKRKKYC